MKAATTFGEANNAELAGSIIARDCLDDLACSSSKADRIAVLSGTILGITHLSRPSSIINGFCAVLVGELRKPRRGNGLTATNDQPAKALSKQKPDCTTKKKSASNNLIAARAVLTSDATCFMGEAS